MREKLENTGDKKKKGTRYFGKHARNAIGLLIFLVFLTAGITDDNWENTYVFKWDQFDQYNFGSWSSYADTGYGQQDNNNNYNGDNYDPATDVNSSQAHPMITPIGSVIKDQTAYPIIMFHELQEQYVIRMQNLSRDYPYDAFTRLGSSNPQLLAIFDDYGKNVIGAYSIGTLPKSDRPGYLWLDTEKNKLIQSYCILPDQDQDGVNDILVSYARTSAYPEFGSGFEYNSPKDFFFTQTDVNGTTKQIVDTKRASQFFDIRLSPDNGMDDSNSAIITPKIQFYQNLILSGDGYTSDASLPENTLARKPIRLDGEMDLGRENAMQVIFDMNSSSPAVDGSIIMLTSNIPKVFYQEAYFWAEDELTSLKLKGYNLVGESLWETNLLSDDFSFSVNFSKLHFPTPSVQTFSFTKSRFPAKIRSLDNGLLLVTGCWPLQNIALPVNFVIDAQTGEKLWMALGDVCVDERPWFEKVVQGQNNNFEPTKIINRNLFVVQFQEFPTQSYYLRMVSINASNGVSLAEYRYSISVDYQMFNVDMELLIGSEYQLQRQNSPDLIVIAMINYEMHFLRLNLQPEGTTVIKQTITSQSTEYEFYDKLHGQSYLEAYPLSVDLDRDQYADILLILQNMAFFISGTGLSMYSRPFTYEISRYNYGYGHQYEYLEFYTYAKFTYLYNDPVDSLRISAVLSRPGYLYYFEDVNSFAPAVSFTEYFPTLSIIFLVAVIIGMIGCVLMILKDTKKLPEKPVDRAPQLTRLVKVSVLATIAVYLTIFIYFMNFALMPRTTDIFISENASIYWFFVIYPLAFILISLIPTLYNKAAPVFADRLYLRTQRKIFNFYMQRKQKDYQALVLHMDERAKVDRSNFLNRSILPLLIGLTLGIYIYTGLAEEGALLNFLRMFNENLPALTNPDNLGVWHADKASIDEIWIEMGKYARYMVLGMFIAYLLSAFIIAPAWLLDDAGVVFYVRCTNLRSINDIDSVSEWFLNFVTGFFGITAIISWAQLFLPMLGNLSTLYAGLSTIQYTNPVFSLIIIVLALVVFPVIATIAIMLSANQKMEQKLVVNADKLFKRMAKAGFDVVPKRIEAILVAKDKNRPGPWTKYYDHAGNPIKTPVIQNNAITPGDEKK